MSAALKDRPPRTLEDFLVWERRQPLRFEWDGVQPVAMTGGTYAHSEIATRLAERLRSALGEGHRCTVVRGDVQVRVGDRARYPDVAVTCAPIRPQDRAVPDPLLVVEVLSDTTTATDRGVKRDEYRSIASVQRYIMLAQDEMLALVCDRSGGDFEEREEREALDLPELRPSGLRLPLAPLYEGLLEAR